MLFRSHLSPSAAAAEDRLGEFRMDVTTETRLDALRRMLDADDDYARRREALLVRLGRKTTPMVTAIGVSCVQDGHAPRRTGKTRVAELKASTALFLRQLTGRQA